jgi:hypothetical protein
MYRVFMWTAPGIGPAALYNPAGHRRLLLIAEWDRVEKTHAPNCGVGRLLPATFAKPSTNFTDSLPSFFAFLSGLWLKTDAGSRNGTSQKWHDVKQR